MSTKSNLIILFFHCVVLDSHAEDIFKGLDILKERQPFGYYSIFIEMSKMKIGQVQCMEIINTRENCVTI